MYQILITIIIRIPVVVYLLASVLKELPFKGTLWDIISVGILILIVLGTFFYFHPIPKKKKTTPFNNKTKEEMQKIQSIQLFNISDIEQPYKALGMIEAHDTDKSQAKEKLQLQALKLGADAVINVSTNIDNNVTGHIGSVATMPRVVSGNTSTVTTYHYEGTAVKLI